MGWRPWELERIEHPREFIEAIQGFRWRMNWEMDLAAFIVFHAYGAQGAKKSIEAGGGPIEMADILGRPLFEESLVPPVEEPIDVREMREMDEADRLAKQERAKFQVWAAMKAKQARDYGQDPSPFVDNSG